jgi:hypothetical protein
LQLQQEFPVSGMGFGRVAAAIFEQPMLAAGQ